jgi:hypothetical protein
MQSLGALQVADPELVLELELSPPEPPVDVVPEEEEPVLEDCVLDADPELALL